MPIHRTILGLRVDATTYDDATARIIGWARAGEARFVCAANVHMVMEAHDDPGLRALLNRASLVTPDGMPLVWDLRARGLPRQPRVYGPTLMLHVCRAAAREGIAVGLYGGHPEALEPLAQRLASEAPGLRLAFRRAPPFSPSPELDLETGAAAEAAEAILAAGVRVLFVGLGCPKQERWMAANVERLGAVLVGVGAAFDFFSGRVRQSPAWMQDLGLEWAYRLSQDPRRLFLRYAKHNPRFVALAAREILRELLAG